MTKRRTIYILLDYAGRFYSEWDEDGFSLSYFTDNLKRNGFDVVSIRHCDVDFNLIDFKGALVLYSSSEIVLKKNLEVSYYKDYIEDILLGIIYKGGILIPDFYLFRAHHNKSFQEIYRNLLSFGNLDGHAFGALNEFVERGRYFKYPLVIKAYDKGGGMGVFLAKDFKDAVKKIKTISSSFDSFFSRSYCQLRAFLAVKLRGKSKERMHRNNARKYVIQEYVQGLNDDWKVLVFGNKYYLLNRKIRENDFRASGSGNFSYVEPPHGLLDYARDIFQKINSPYASIDIAFNGKNFFLIEFQGLYFGIYTVLNAGYYYCMEEGSWVKKVKSGSVEEDMADAVADFVKENHP